MGLYSRAQEIVGPKTFTHEITFNEPPVFQKMRYETGPIACSDWTNRHLGSDTTKNADSNVTHNLGVPLRKLRVRVLVSTDGTDANSFEVTGTYIDSGVRQGGYTVSQVNENAIKVQTALEGLIYLDDSGNGTLINNEDWYYNIVVERAA